MTIGLFTFIGVICAGTLTSMAAGWLGGIVYDWLAKLSVKRDKGMDSLFDNIAIAVEEHDAILRLRAKERVSSSPEALPGGYRAAAKPSLEEEIRALKERVAFLENAPAELDYEIEEIGKEITKRKREDTSIASRVRSAKGPISVSLDEPELAPIKRYYASRDLEKRMREERKASKKTMDVKTMKETLDSLPIGYRVRAEEQEAAAKLEKTLDEANKVATLVASGNFKVGNGRE